MECSLRWWTSLSLLVLAGCPKVEQVPPRSVQVELGSEGGTIVGPDGVELVVPPGALAAPVTLGIARANGGAPTTAPGYPVQGAVFELTPHGQRFALPVTIRAPAGSAAPVVLMAERDAGWELIHPATTDTTAQWEVTHFSWFYTSPQCQPPPNDPQYCGWPTCTVEAEATPGEALAVLVPPTPGGGLAESRLRADGMARLSVRYDAPTGSTGCALEVFELEGLNARLLHRLTTPSEQGSWSWSPTLDRARPAVFLASFDCTRGEVTRRGSNVLKLHFGDTWWRVGGTVSGLTASGLVLANGSEALPVLANGAFAFSTQVLHAGPYSVSVKTTPPGHACAVLSGVGVATANVTTVEVRCVPGARVGGHVSGLLASGLVLQNRGGDDLAVAADGPFTFATPVALGTAYGVTVKSAPVGQVCTVQRDVGTATADVTDVVVSCTSSGWSAASQLAANIVSPSLSMDPSGNGLAVWLQPAGNGLDVWGSRYTLAGGWQPAQLLETAAGLPGSPQVALDAAGNGFAVWSQVLGGTTSVARAARFTPAGGWQPPQDVESAPGSSGAPSVSFAPNGDAWLVWTQATDPMMSRVRAARFSGGSWGTPTSIDGDQGLVAQPRVVTLSNGITVAVWVQSLATDFIFFNTFNGTGWSTADALDGANTNSLAQAPALAADANGNAMVVWSQGDGVGQSVYARRLVRGNWEPVESVEGHAVALAVEPRLLVDAGGEATVVWLERAGVESRLWSRRFSPSTGWSAEVEISAALGTGAGQPALARHVAGEAMVLWPHTAMGGSLWASTGTTRWTTPLVLGTRAATQVLLATNGTGQALALWLEGTTLWSKTLR